MGFDKKQILHLANLAKLELKNEELEAYNKELQDILSYVEKINNLDLEDIPESFRGLSDEGLGPRPDVVQESEASVVLAAGQKDGDYIPAPNVFNK